MGFLFGGAPKTVMPPPPSGPSTEAFEQELRSRKKSGMETLLTGGLGIQEDLLASKTQPNLKKLLGE